MTARRFYVRIDRLTDGSRTYKGPMPKARAEKEQAAWNDAFPDWPTEIIPVADARKDVRTWETAIRPAGARYYPNESTS